MNGAEAVVRSLVASGVDTCFANPGTSEMHFVAALDKVSGMRCVLGLAETVVTACADGYGRIAGKPAVAVMHLGSGYSNSMASLHNARSCRTPVVALAGDVATYHKQSGSRASSDLEGMARVASDWVRTAASAQDAGNDAAEAVCASRTAPGRIATLILPGDVSWNDGAQAAAPMPVPQRARVGRETVQSIARVLRGSQRCILVLEGLAQTERGLLAAQRIAAATGARLHTPASVPCMARGRGRVPVQRIPYVIDPALRLLEGVEHVILVEALNPVPFFAYPGKPNSLAPRDASTHVLARPEEDGLDALDALADELGAPSRVAMPVSELKPERANGAFTPDAFANTIGVLLPENAIVVDDAVSSGRPLFDWTHNAAPHHWLMNCGGAIGHGLPSAAGAAVAAPDRKVVCIQADGAGMYTVQSLWTHARQKLDIVTVILANRKYKILYDELRAVGAQPGPAADDLFRLENPELDWVKIAGGLGVEAARVHDLQGFADLFSRACRTRGPFLIEFRIDT